MVPLLLRTNRQEDAEGASNEERERDLKGVGTPGVFFVSASCSNRPIQNSKGVLLLMDYA